MGSKALTGWGYVYETATGQLVSEGSVIADPLPAELALWQSPARHDVEAQRWDPATAQIVAYVNADRIAELKAQREADAARIIALGGTP